MEKNIPTLRFPEFVGEWVVKRLGDVASRIVSKNKEKNTNVLTISAQYGLISQLEFFNKSVSAKDVSGYYLLSRNDFAYNKSYSNGYPMGAIKRLSRYDKGVVSTLYICFKNTTEFDNSFAEQYFETGKQNEEIEKVAQEGARNHGLLNIGVSDFFNIEVTIPEITEQTKIASFLTAVDNKLSQLKRKKELLEHYKKGVMQKLFSQELRFKDENGEDYPEWEEKPLGECLGYIQPTNYLVSSTEYDDSFNIPVLTAGKTFILGYTNETTGIFKDNLPVIIFDDFTTATQFVDFPFKAKSSAMKILIANKNVNIKFMYEAMQILDYEIGGHERHWISKFSQLNLLIPTLKEQTKIANFLSAIDEKIQYNNQQIAKMESWKKGLLQQMFV